MTITELSIKRPTLVVVFFTVLLLLGGYSYTTLQYELLPKMNIPVLTIITAYPGAAPEEIESTVTKPIEDAVSGVDKVSSITSISQEGVSILTLEFQQSANIEIALQDVQRKVAAIKALLPSGIKDPVINKIAFDEIPILRMGATSNLPPRDFYQFVVDNVKPRLSRVPGVADVVLLGGEQREIHVNLDPARLRTYRISLTQVAQALTTANLDVPAGKVADAQSQYIVRLSGKFTSLDQIRQLVIARTPQGQEIRLSDIATVQDATAEPTTYYRINGKPSLGIYVQKQSEANAVDVSRAVRAEIEKLQQQYAYLGLSIIVAQDASTFTLDAVHAVQFDLGLAVLIVAAVMLLFLHSIRNSLIVMLAIPTSLISTFIGMYAFGLTLNLMTLLGMSLVIGILVDDSIVVLENIYKHLEHGEDRVTAAIRGRNEIGFAALAITLVDVAVFLPLSLVSGIVGNIMREFALVVVTSTLLSLLVSFTLTPMLASRFARLERLSSSNLLGRIALAFENWFSQVTERYGVALRWALRRRWVPVAVTGASFIVVPLLFANGLIGFEFFTQADRGEFAVTVEFPPSYSLEQTDVISRRIEQFLLSIPEVKRVITGVGVSNEGFLGQNSNNVVEFSVTLVPKTQRQRSTDEIGNIIKREIFAMPGVKARVNPVGIFGTANLTPIQIIVSGTDRRVVDSAATLVAATLRQIQGTTDIRLSSEKGKPEVQVTIDRARLADYGLSVAEVGAALRIALQGNDDAKYRYRGTEYPIRIWLEKSARQNPDEIAHLTVANRLGQQIEIGQFATVSLGTGPTKLQRRDRNPAVIVYAQTYGKASGSIANEFDRMIAGKLPLGVRYDYAGDVKNQRQGFGDLGIALIGAIVFVYLIMVALYDSYFYPFVNLFSVPGAVIGAFLALALTLNNLSIITMLGLIMLIGLVTKNAILLIDRTIANIKERHLPVHHALVEAGESRLRPIVMTTVAMVVGMFPIALSNSPGSEWKSGLAWALIGGLTSSMFLTLFLVPVIFSYLTQLFGRFKQVSAAVQPAPNGVAAIPPHEKVLKVDE
ncbi:MAG: efflux RND transporter permease subunit [Candidatus Kapabacteria bacterium]|nr:efflux RND transporter permease subunit [Candidatus Kapabacteria bacterium]